jgi:hypothetical protein
LSVNSLLPAAAFEAGPEFSDGAGAVWGPDHARLFETSADDMFAATLDGAGANLPTVGSIAIIAHTMLVIAEVSDNVTQARLMSSVGLEVV